MKFTLNLNKKEDNMNKSKFILFTAVFAAITFTFSCSSDVDGSDNTYFYSIYGFTDESFCYYLLESTDGNSLSDSSLAAVEYTFQEVKNMWLEIKTISGVTIESMNNYAESSLKNDLMVSGGLAPSQVDAFMGELNNRKNSLLFGYSNDSRYCALAMYFEKE